MARKHKATQHTTKEFRNKRQKRELANTNKQHPNAPSSSLLLNINPLSQNNCTTKTEYLISCPLDIGSSEAFLHEKDSSGLESAYNITSNNQTPTNTIPSTISLTNEQTLNNQPIKNEQTLNIQIKKISFMQPVYPIDTEEFEKTNFDSNQAYRIPKTRPVRIYCDGVYDLFHYGHARQLFQAKKLFPNVYLLVGVSNDILTHKYKGITVMSELERYESVRHCKYVDEVIEDAPWVITNDFIRMHRVDYVAHDDIPYAGDASGDIYGSLKKAGKFIPTKRTLGISTSGIITRIVRDYDAYLRRQIMRGISREDLNISGFKETRVRIQGRLLSEIEDIKTKLKDNHSKIKNKLNNEIKSIKTSINEKKEKLTHKLHSEISEIKNEFSVIMNHWENLSNIWLEKFISKFESSKDGWLTVCEGACVYESEGCLYNESVYTTLNVLCDTQHVLIHSSVPFLLS